MSVLSDTPYNFEHFRTSHLIVDAIRTWRLSGVKPGEWAPDFELDDTNGEPWRLSAHRGRAVLLHFGSPT
jgi:hypothetical protein